MSLVVVAIFDDLKEGEIAASILRSSNIPGWLLGSEIASMRTFERRAWGGVRLSFPGSCAGDAQEIVREARSGVYALDDELDIRSPATSAWAAPVALLALFGGAGAGWGLSGVRRRPSAFRIIGTVIALLGVLPFVFGAALEALLYLISDVYWLTREAY